MFACVIGISLNESVCFLSIRIGLLVVLCIFLVLLFMAVRVGGGQLVNMLVWQKGHLVCAKLPLAC